MSIRLFVTAVTLALVSTGCASTTASRGPDPVGPSGNVVVLASNDGPARGPRRLNGVPPGHYPPPGQCRVWYQGRPPGQQPPPVPCGSLRGRVPFGTFLLFGGRGWDTEYDWRRHERLDPGSVPNPVLSLMVEIRSP
jgi:hypothetical protein